MTDTTARHPDTTYSHTLPSRFARRLWRLAHPSHALAGTLRGPRGARHRSWEFVRVSLLIGATCSPLGGERVPIGENMCQGICLSTPKVGCRLQIMTYTLEISDELKSRLDDHLEEDESHEAFIEELVSMYETEGAFLQEGYSE